MFGDIGTPTQKSNQFQQKKSWLEIKFQQKKSWLEIQPCTTASKRSQLTQPIMIQKTTTRGNIQAKPT